MEDEDRLAAPEHLDDLALGDGREIDIERGGGGGGGGVRFHLADQRDKGRRRADGCHGSGRNEEEIAARRLRCGDCRHRLNPRPSCRAFHARCDPTTLSPTSRLRETEGAGPAADGRVSFQPGGDQKQRNPAAVYWHPYRRSASMPTNAAARLPQRPCKAGAAPMRIALYQPDIPQNTGTI